VSHSPESGVAFNRNGVSHSIGIACRVGPEYAPERTYVYIDSLTASAYLEIINPAEGYLGDVDSIRIEPNQLLMWDSKPWTVLNVGNKNVFLKSEQDESVQLPLSALHQLVIKGSILQVDHEEDSVEKRTHQIIVQASPKDLHEALRRMDAVRPFLSGEKKRSKASATEKRYIKSYVTFEKEIGNGFLGLLPQTKKRGNRKRKISDEVIALMQEMIEVEFEEIKAKNIESVYGTLTNLCESKGLTAPSRITFIKAINSQPQESQVRKRQGRRAAYKYDKWYWSLDRKVPKHGSFPFQICHIDHTELDVELIHPVSGRNLGKPWLTIMIDAYSRLIVGFYLTFDAPSYVSCMMVLRDCVKRFQRLPNTLVLDNGKEFGSIYFECLLAQFECTKKSRPPAKSKFGSVCERFFGITNTQFVHNLRGNTKAMKNVRTVTKSVNPKNLAVWDFKSLYELLEEYLFDIYAGNEHPSINATPKEGFERGLIQSGARAHRIIPYNRSFIIRTLPTTRKGVAKVNSNSGIQIEYLRYWHDSFREPDIAGTSIPVRLDPDDSGVIYAFVRNVWVICKSDMYTTFKGRSRKEVRNATQELNKNNSISNKKRLLSANRIAIFLRKAEEIEGMSLQRAKDQERFKITQQANPLTPAPNSSQKDQEETVNTETLETPRSEEDTPVMEIF